jgi:DNA-binding transcriptional regulator GbsR (MarR family)
MDLTVDSDIYEPNIDDHGDYADYLPSSSKFKNGLRCSCGSRKEHIFDTRQSFSSHIKTKTHQKWISDLNMNKMNHFTENIKLNETINNQKLIIARLQRENDENIKLIAHLTKKIEFRDAENSVLDLLTFD